MAVGRVLIHSGQVYSYKVSATSAILSPVEPTKYFLDDPIAESFLTV